MSLKAEDFPDIESFNIQIVEFRTEGTTKIPKGRSVSKFKNVEKIYPSTIYREYERDAHSYDLAFQFKGMYRDKETKKVVSKNYDAVSMNPFRHCHITRTITYTIKYREKENEEKKASEDFNNPPPESISTQ